MNCLLKLGVRFLDLLWGVYCWFELVVFLVFSVVLMGLLCRVARFFSLFVDFGGLVCYVSYFGVCCY